MAFSRANNYLGSIAADNTVVSVTQSQRDAAVSLTQLNERVQTLYSIALYDTLMDEVFAESGLDPAGRTNNAEYFFRVPPKVHEFDEPFATTITNTQDAGKYVESYGSILKSIRISGTTGLRPNKVTSPTVPGLGITVAQAENLRSIDTDSVRKLAPSESTGYDDIIFLRNVFRKYSDIKLSDELSGSVVMLWRNIKDADYWIVEPEDFRVSQSSSSPLTYDYSISFKTLSRFDFSYALPADPLDAARSKQRMLSRLQDYSQNLLNTFLVISSNINKLQAYGTFITDLILSPVLGIINGLAAVRTAGFGVATGLLNQVTKLAEDLPEAIDKLGTVLPAQDSVTRALRRLELTCANILSEPIASKPAIRNVGWILNKYAKPYERPGSGTTAAKAPTNSPSYIGYERAPAVVNSSTIYPAEDIRDVAARLLGDRSRWKILVTLNELSSPFISPTGGPGVLMPGDAILYPADRVVGGAPATVGAQDPTTDGTRNNSQANTAGQLAYGRDLRLQSTFVGSSEITDLVVNQRGDLGSIVGIPNIEQAIRIKFITERGELPAHSKFGAKFPIGRKASPASFSEFRIDALRTLVSDNRIQTVKSLDFLAIEDVLALAADLVITDSQNILSTSFALRRF